VTSSRSILSTGCNLLAAFFFSSFLSRGFERDLWTCPSSRRDERSFGREDSEALRGLGRRKVDDSDRVVFDAVNGDD
jgi:hypothetical protein